MVDRAIIEAIERLAGRIASIEAHGKPVDGLSLAEALVIESLGVAVRNAAFAVPGGWIYVNRGLIERAENMSQLAGVLSHEIGHVTRRHSVQQMQQAQGANGGVLLLCTLTKICDSGTGQTAVNVAGTALFAKFSRSDEAEADQEAVMTTIEDGEQLERELAKPGYVVKPIMLGSNTDPYQPIEREQQLTRRLLEVFDRTSHPVGIVTKSALVLRDIDLLASLASRGLTKVALSITTLDHRLARRMEPRASTPMKRVDALRRLSEAGVPTVIMTAPIIPVINDHEIEALLATGAQAGARQAAYVLVRLPLEISPLFQEWLTEEFPDRAKRVMSLIRSTRGGKDYVSDFGERQTGAGVYGAQIARRYRVALQKHGLNERRCTLRCDIFQAPVAKGGQFTLFQP